MRNFHLKALRATAIALLPGESAEAKSRDERAAVLVRVASGQPSSVLLWATKIGGDTEESFLNKAKPVEWSSRQMQGGAHSKGKWANPVGPHYVLGRRGVPCCYGLSCVPLKFTR